jgi:hypothetical protein
VFHQHQCGLLKGAPACITDTVVHMELCWTVHCLQTLPATRYPSHKPVRASVIKAVPGALAILPDHHWDAQQVCCCGPLGIQVPDDRQRIPVQGGVPFSTTANIRSAQQTH